MKRALSNVHLLPALTWQLFQSRALEDDSEPADASCRTCGHSHAVGGQAVLEGVMMRGKRAWGLAVRQPSGNVARHSFLLHVLSQRYPVLKLPVIRGVVALGESLSLGIKALGLSANLSTQQPIFGDEDEGADCSRESVQLGVRDMALSLGIAIVFSIVLFVVIPLAVTKQIEGSLESALLFNLVEGLIRIGIFLGYVVIISRIPDLRRVFQYHGAEHKTIHAFEEGEELLPDRVNQRYSTLHPRCGTAFLLIVMVMAILVFALVGKPGLWVLVLSRIVGIPLVAGISYEVIKYAGRHKDGFFAQVVLWPGLGLQRLTTREPTDDQVEVAIHSLEEVLRVDAGEDPLPCTLETAGRVAPAGVS